MTDRELERIALAAASHPNARTAARMLRNAQERYRHEARENARRRKAALREVSVADVRPRFGLA